MRPMKAEDVICPKGKHNEADLIFPLLASPKLDGIRALIIDGQVRTSKLKLIPNKHVQKLFGKKIFNGLDGELLINQPTQERIYRNTASAVMSMEGTPDVLFHVFDRHDLVDEPYTERHYALLGSRFPDNILILPQRRITNLKTLLLYEKEILEQGYEGVMLRSPDSLYKYGRSTWKQHWLLKLKRFQQDEAIIVGYEEQMKNNNAQKTSELGLKKRSSHKENKVGKDTLGALIVKSKKFTKPFPVGSGFDDDEREEFWNNQLKYLGRMITFKHFAYGDYDQPRHPTYVGLRDRRTL